MKKEIEFQRELVKDTVAVGGYGLKLSNRFLVGVPDLFLALDGQCAFIELKAIQWPKTKGKVEWGVTKIQESVLRRIAKSGISAVMGAVFIDGKDQLLLISEPSTSSVTDWNNAVINGFRQEYRQWPIKKILFSANVPRVNLGLIGKE